MIALLIAAWIFVGFALAVFDMVVEAKDGQEYIPKKDKWFYPACLFLGPLFLVFLMFAAPIMWYTEKDLMNPFANYFKKRRQGDSK